MLPFNKIQKEKNKFKRKLFYLLGGLKSFYK